MHPAGLNTEDEVELETPQAGSNTLRGHTDVGEIGQGRHVHLRGRGSLRGQRGFLSGS